jgi:hypothetical protein
MGIDPAALSEVLERLRHGTAWRGFLTEQRALLRCWPGLLKMLPAITTPAAVLAGTRTASSAHLRRWLSIERSTAPRCIGHLIPAHTPAAVAELVLKFVRC